MSASKRCERTATFALARGPLGWTLAAVDSDGGVCAAFLGETRTELCEAVRKRFPRETWREVEAGPAERALLAVNRAIETPTAPRAAGVRLAPVGTFFQQRVWSELRTLRVGETVTYAALARRAGRPRAVRAVAQACGANPIAVLIPCHRVIAASGALSGYRWGVERKAALLEREGVDLALRAGANQT